MRDIIISGSVSFPVKVITALLTCKHAKTFENDTTSYVNVTAKYLITIKRK